MTTTTTVKDPVCGMDVDPDNAAGQTVHNGQTYSFCGPKCKERFDLDPARYAGKSAETPKSGPG